MARGRTYRRKKADGSWSRWYAVIDEPVKSGDRRRQITRAFDTQREAHKWLALQSMNAAGNADTDSEILVSQWLNEWMSDQAFTKPSTQATNRAHADRYLMPFLGQLKLSELDHGHVADLVADLDGSGLAPATTRRIIATLQTAMSQAVRFGHRTTNPVRGVRLPQIAGSSHTVWTADQSAAFLAACSLDGLGVLFRLALVTGMRRGELLGLSWADVDLNSNELLVRSTRVAVGGRVLVGTPKSRFGVRRVYLDAQTCSALVTWRRQQGCQIGSVEDLVFTHTDGTTFLPWWVSRRFDRMISDLDLPRIRFHDLRHTSATLGLIAGESLKEISVRLGHADIRITANVYSEILPETAHASVARRAQLMSGDKRSVIRRVV